MAVGNRNRPPPLVGAPGALVSPPAPAPLAPITLEAAAYWQLRALGTALELARVQQDLGRQRFLETCQATDAALAAMRRYMEHTLGLDTRADYRFDDGTLTVTRQPPAKG